MTMIKKLASTKSKKHIVGGVLLSASIFFEGLVLAVMSAKNEENINE